MAFRIYDPNRITNADKEFHHEYVMTDSHAYRQRVLLNSEWHRNVFLKRGKVGLYTNWVTAIAHTTYDDLNRFMAIPGEKAVFMNPRCTRDYIDKFMASVF